MILNGINNQKVELKIIGYQFPDAKNDSSDSEWLKIFLDVQSNLGNWQTIDSSLTAPEVKELIRWFKDLSTDKEVEYTELYFTEPNLEFNFIKGEDEIKNIKIIFNAESKPKFAKMGQEYFVEFQFSNEELSEAADELDEELKQHLSS